MGTEAMILVFWMLSFKPTFYSPLSFASRGLLVLHHFLPLSLVQFSHSVASNSLQPHESQHARPPCPSPTPGVYPNSCPSSWWCRPAILFSVTPFSSCPQPLPASGFFPPLGMRWPKYWSFSLSISPSNEHPGLISLRMDWLDLLAVQGTLRVFSNTTGQKHQLFGAQLSLWSSSHIHTWLLEKNHSLD